YCNTRSANVLEGKPLEKQLESHALGSQPGSIHGVLQTPYFYTAPDTARVNLAMEIPSDTFQFNKDKGKYHANLNVLGIAYRTAWMPFCSKTAPRWWSRARKSFLPAAIGSNIRTT